ncbi:stage V sporulation protein AB [Xylanibacillus composti]|uniref:Stage V sporulation protein AB n=1 Tax=Xylanibacillus composti TaxID=1572762 RepID=A0A8J4H6I1_9BACL|nr:stage V sporulation protein AB [Xylanibacillus composti]MDT9726675.1 stage V sporulation protein AB [Xylanibacillus composti]GIQ69393.1 stage V sporulation protein AB [Xylanibacillus composti]
MAWLAAAFAMLLGLAGGLIVGSGLVALLTVLDIIPRLAQVACMYKHVDWLERAVVSGAFFWTVADFFDLTFGHFALGAVLVGLLQGIFVGMLAAALTEVLNVLPILSRRLRMEAYMMWFVIAMMAGKVVGSLFDWLVYQRL